MFAQDLEIPKHESTEIEDFLTPPELPQPETPQPLIKELSPELPSFLEPIREEPSAESIPQHRTLTPVKSILKARFQ